VPYLVKKQPGASKNYKSRIAGRMVDHCAEGLAFKDRPPQVLFDDPHLEVEEVKAHKGPFVDDPPKAKPAKPTKGKGAAEPATPSPRAKKKATKKKASKKKR